MLAAVPRLSVGLPVWNGERYIEETLRSILGQTYGDFEVVIGDNASTDRTGEICRDLAAGDPRVRYCRHPRNLGAAPNYNSVFEMSSGSFFKWADYDDVLEPTFVERTVEVLERDPGVGVCFPHARLIDEHGTVLRDYAPGLQTVGLRPHERFRNLVLHPDHYAIEASGLMRADVIRRSVMHASFSSSDEVFLAHMALLARFEQVPEPLIRIRMHPRQSTKGVLASERARVLFFDTSLRGRTVLVKFLYVRYCVRAIRRSPLPASERARCYLHLYRWMLQRGNRRGLAKDALLWMHSVVPLFPGLQRGAQEAAAKGDR